MKTAHAETLACLIITDILKFDPHYRKHVIKLDLVKQTRRLGKAIMKKTRDKNLNKNCLAKLEKQHVLNVY